jgi:hypothetical protein
VSIRTRGLFLSLLALSLGSAALAQQFGIGATYGWVNDVEHTWQLNNFHKQDWEVWFETRLQENVVTRAAYGELSVSGDSVGSTVIVDGAPVVIPNYNDKIGYVTLDVSYVFRKGPWMSGLFAGIGGYHINPGDISPPELEPYRDPDETVFGWNAGVDGDLHLYRGLSLVGRLTFHGILTDSRRYLLVASVGAVYRF